jgi:hypothetical protein
MTVGSFLYRLFFTRDDDLDLLQVFYMAAIIFFGVAFVQEARGIWHPSEKAWDLFRWIFSLLVITGVPIWATKLVIAHKEAE